MKLETLLQAGRKLVAASPSRNAPVVQNTVQDLMVLEKKCCRPLQVVLMGEVKAGKSTLLNALAGEAISPVGITETTAAVIRVHYDAAPEAKIIFQDGHEEQDDMAKILQRLEEHRGNMVYFQTCREVVIGMPLPALQHMELIDTPGLNTVTQQNQMRSTNFMQEADVVIWLINCQRLGTQSDEEMLEQLHDMGKKVIVVVSRMDERRPEEYERVLDYVESRYEDYIDIALPFAGQQAMEAVQKQDNALAEMSGLTGIRTYIQQHFCSKADEVQTDKILDSLQASMRKDCLFHRSEIDRYQQNLQLYQQLTRDLEEQSQVIQRDFQRMFSDWGMQDLLHGAEKELCQHIDAQELLATSSLEERVEPFWRDLLSVERVQSEVQAFVQQSEQKLGQAWYSTLERISQRLERLPRQAMTTQNLQAELAFDETGSTMLLSTVGKSAAASAIVGTGASAYAAGLGTYAAHLSMAGALGSFMLPTLLVGLGIGAVKGYLNFDQKKKELKQKAHYNIIDVRRQVLGSLQEKYKQMIGEACEGVCQGAQHAFLDNLFHTEDLSEIQAYYQACQKHLRDLQNYLQETPSYETVTTEFRERLAAIRQGMVRRVDAGIASLQTEGKKVRTEKEVQQELDRMRGRLEQEQQAQLQRISEQQADKERLLAATQASMEQELVRYKEELERTSAQLAQRNAELQRSRQELAMKTKQLDALQDDLAEARRAAASAKDDDEKIRRMYKQLRQQTENSIHIDENHYQEISQKLGEQFPEFDAQALKLLASAELLYHLFTQRAVQTMDYAPVVIDYGECAEYLLQQVLTHRNMWEPSGHYVSMQEIISTYVRKRRWRDMWEDGFLELIEEIRRERNNSAHPAGRNRDNAHHMRTMMLGDCEDSRFPHGVLPYFNEMLR